MTATADSPDIAVVAPLPMELAAFRRSLTNARTLRREGRRWILGNLGETLVLTAALGDGRERTTATLERLFTVFPLRRILLIGVAGGLDPALSVGQVVVAERIVKDEQSAPPPAASWLAAAVESGLAAADVISVDRIVASPEEKARLWRRLGGERPAVADLESAALAHTADAAGVPYLVLRAVSDGAKDTLPSLIPRCQRPDGSVNSARVALGALLSPTAIPQLLALRRRVDRCATALAEAAQAVCR